MMENQRLSHGCGCIQGCASLYSAAAGTVYGLPHNLQGLFGRLDSAFRSFAFKVFHHGFPIDLAGENEPFLKMLVGRSRIKAVEVGEGAE
jgi:hypothetical protein